MVKILARLALFPVVSLTGCGLTTLEDLDTSLMGDGNGSRTALGGYWWTYVDRTLASKVKPNTGKLDPTNARSTALKVGLAPGYGLEIDGSHPAYHVTGKVVPVPSSLESDSYWSEFYGEICQDGDCGEQKYPAAGIGFGFKPKNAPLGRKAFASDGSPLKGIGFRMKLGIDHARVDDVFQPVAVSAPMDLTDAPDPSFGDKFGTLYAELNTALYPDADRFSNFPICSFPSTYKPDGKRIYGASNKTCFCNLTKTLDATDQWKTFCVPWEEFESPPWGDLNNALVPDGGITQVIPERLIKIQFDAYKPSAGEEEAAFDIWIDDVRLLGDTAWDGYCASERL